MVRKKLGELLVEAGLITEEQLKHAIEVQSKTGEKLGKVLIKSGYVTESQILEALEFQLGIPHVDLHKYYIDPEVAKLIPEAVAKRHTIIPIKKIKMVYW